MGNGFTSFGGFSWIFMILWWALIIAGIIALMRWLVKDQSRKTQEYGNTPLEILKDRYAKGEINSKEFEERKKNLL